MKPLKKCNAVAALVVLVAFSVAPNVRAALTSNLVLAQAAFPIPAPLPQGTTVKIDGSSSMQPINQALSDRFKTQFPGTQVNLGYGGSDAALQAVLDGKVDLAAIGRPLTAEEQAKGLVAVPVARSKIAVFVGADNPFTEGLTGEQFASIFRGEITDWSQMGGADLPIRFIDRPDTSDTRRAFVNYPVFQVAPFQSGATTVKLPEDSTSAAIQQLGNDGISYGIVDQVRNNLSVRILPLYGTLPDDPRYPFSQPFSYVYKGTPGPAIQAFLGMATAPDSQAVVETARVAAVTTAVPAAAPPSATVIAPAPTAAPQVNASSPAASPGKASPGTVASSSPVAPASPNVAVSASPGNLITTMDDEGLWSRWWWLFPLLGGLALLAWLLRGRSHPDDTRADLPLREPIVPTTTIPAASGAALVSTPLPTVQDSRIILTPRNCKAAYAYWEVSEAHTASLKQQGGRDLTLRLYDVTDIDAYYQTPHSVHEFACSEDSHDLHVPIPLDDRDYIAEIGYMTTDQRWLPLARSPHVRVPVCAPLDKQPITIVEAPPTVMGNNLVAPAQVEEVFHPLPGVYEGNAAVQAKDVHPHSLPGIYEDNAPLPGVYNPIAGESVVREAVAVPHSEQPRRSPTESRLLLVPRSAEEIYAYWEVSEERKQDLRQQGGQRLVLRVYDITGVDLSDQPPRGLQQFECSETTNDRHVSVPSYGDYVATLGYLTEGGRWLSVARSSPVRIRSANAPTTWQTPRDH